jgi:hypothetical protein
VTVTAGRADLRDVPDEELAAHYPAASEADQAAILAECERRDRQAAQAKRARDKRAAVAAEWEAEAYAQYRRAEEYTRGYLLSPAGERTGRDPFPMLWQVSLERALKLGSEELVEFWTYVEPRTVTLAEYRRQARQPRPEEPGEPWETVPGGAVRPVKVLVGRAVIAAWSARGAAGTTTVHPSRERAERWLSPAPAPVRAPPPRPAAPPVAPGAIARYTGALDILTARALAVRARITNGGSR